MTARMMSFVVELRREPLTVIAMVLNKYQGGSGHGARASTWLVLMLSSAPKAPCVEVRELAAHDRHAGLRGPTGADDVNDALISVAQGVQAHAGTLGILAQRRSACGS